MGPKTKGYKGDSLTGLSPVEKKTDEGMALGGEKIQLWVRSARIPADVRKKIFRYAASALPVFIQGEEGTGRDEAAKALHFFGPWRDSYFLHFSCTNLKADIFLDRLSLRLKGPKQGKRVSLTLYLEDVEKLEGEMQTLLLDLIKNQQVLWPGLERISFDVQFLSSSASSLAEAVSAKRFRNDLFELLDMLTLVLKPLRERKEEIPQIVREILLEGGPDKPSPKKCSPEALLQLQQYNWPGNLPELESVIRRSAALKDGDELVPEDLCFRLFSRESSLPSLQEKEGSWLNVILPTLAHEMKNPMVAITTFAHLLPEKYDDPEFRGEFSGLVNQDVRRINELLENLLEFAHFTKPRPSPLDLNLVLGEVLQQQETFFRKRGAQFNCETAEELPLISFDGVQLSFLLRNLLENALGKMEGKEPLLVQTRLLPVDGPPGQRDRVELEARYDGQEGVMGTIQRSVGLEGVPEFQNLSLSFLLIRHLMIRNGGEMQVQQEGEAGTSVRLQFPTR